MKLKKFILFLPLVASLLLILLNACSVDQESELGLTPTPTMTRTQRQGTLAPTARPVENTPEPTSNPLLGDLINERTPQPTATPGVLMQSIETFAAQRGFMFTRFLGIRVVDWINFIISILIALAGYLLGTWFIKRILPRLVRRTDSQFDDELLETRSAQSLRWLVTIIILRFAITDQADIHRGKF
jgi:hypothetical protein